MSPTSTTATIPAPAPSAADPSRRFRDLVEEAMELGPSGLAFRVRWELGIRSGWRALVERPPRALRTCALANGRGLERIPFARAEDARAVATPHLDAAARAALGARARDAAQGRIVAFGRWTADYGRPIDWHRNPVTGARWNPGAHWTEVLRDTGRAGDVKLTWEVGRFPHAYDLARAAVHGAIPRREAAGVLAAQISAFVAQNPYGQGVHWASGQEIVFRQMAWLFAVAALRGEPALQAALPDVARHLYEGAVHVERNIEYAQHAVYNNHLLSEAFGLYLAGVLLPEAPQARRWVARGLAILTEQADRQVYADGGYLQQSHTYHRVAMQVYLWAAGLARREGRTPPPRWLRAMARSVDFLAAHQNPTDGRLPNYGANDGALPSPLSSCTFGDFRPTLQALSLATRGTRLYGPGPWDEEAAWTLGAAALDAPVRAPAATSASFPTTGFHVLRARSRADSFLALRCGSLRDRFSQIDMLHVDLFWRGENVLVDAGTYLYNGPAEWHGHFIGTRAHNTVTVDGRDQMVHHRKFKVLYPTVARLLRFTDAGAWSVAEGEHDGFRRWPGACVHRRAVLHVDGDLTVVVDRVAGTGSHAARLHWLAGPYPRRCDADAGRLSLDTPQGAFTVTVLDGDARPLPIGVVAGAEQPPRGWLSRHYGEKVPTPSLEATQVGPAPLTFVSVLCAGTPAVRHDRDLWEVEAGGRRARFRLVDGRFEDVVAAGAAR